MLSCFQTTARLQAPRRPATSIAALAAAAFAMLSPVGPIAVAPAAAKAPGKTYCFHRVCHRVMTLEETNRAVGKRMAMHASHYDDPKKDRFNPSNLTSSGEWFRAGTPDNAASPTLPNGTVILAWNPATRQSAVLRVNNAGPYWGSRTLDVSRAAAERLGFARRGVAKLFVEVVKAPTREEATYRRGRRYAAVPGPIGTHATFEMALATANVMMGLQAPPTTLVASLPGATAADHEAATRAGPNPAGPASTPVVPAMPAAVAAIAALAEQTAAAGAAALATIVQAQSIPDQEPASQTPGVIVAPRAAPATASTKAAPAKVASTQAKPRKPAQTAQAAKPNSTAKTGKAQPVRVAAAQTPRARTRTGNDELVKAEIAMRARISGARAVRLASLDADDDEDDVQPLRRAAQPAQRRAVSSYSGGRLSPGCRDDSSACDGEGAGNGRLAPGRTWRVSSSKRQ